MNSCFVQSPEFAICLKSQRHSALQGKCKQIDLFSGNLNESNLVLTSTWGTTPKDAYVRPSSSIALFSCRSAGRKSTYSLVCLTSGIHRSKARPRYHLGWTSFFPSIAINTYLPRHFSLNSNLALMVVSNSRTQNSARLKGR